MNIFKILTCQNIHLTRLLPLLATLPHLYINPLLLHTHNSTPGHNRNPTQLLFHHTIASFINKIFRILHISLLHNQTPTLLKTNPHLPPSQATTHLPPQSNPLILPQSNVNFSQPNSRRPLQTTPHVPPQTQIAYGMENLQIKPTPHYQNSTVNRYSLD